LLVDLDHFRCESDERGVESDNSVVVLVFFFDDVVLFELINILFYVFQFFDKALGLQLKFEINIFSLFFKHFDLLFDDFADLSGSVKDVFDVIVGWVIFDSVDRVIVKHH